METPSSTRRITSAAAISHKSKQEDSQPRSRNGEPRAPLIDITNDSPVVGLATGFLAAEKTPSSSAVKGRVQARRTPGSGEQLLRGQVRTLLQKVEEDAELVNKLPFGHPPPPPPPPSFPALLGLSRSPFQLLAPTPANTPQIPNLNCSKEGCAAVEFATPCVLFEEDDHQQVAEDLNPEEPHDPRECLINRALTFDSPEKSDTSTISSSLTYQYSSESSHQEKSPEDDDDSIWSIQVNASADDLEEEEEDIKFGESTVAAGEEEEAEEEDDDEENLLGDLCEGLKKMSMVGDKPRLPEFTGKHTRFIYNSEDEMEGEEEVSEKAVSPSVLVLKGLPAPEGKHLRFPEEDEEED